MTNIHTYLLDCAKDYARQLEQRLLEDSLKIARLTQELEEVHGKLAHIARMTRNDENFAKAPGEMFSGSNGGNEATRGGGGSSVEIKRDTL